MAVSARTMRTAQALASFVSVVMDPELGGLMGDPEVCDFLAGNPEEASLPGYVETLQKWTVAEDRSWYAYSLGDARASAAAAEGLAAELGIAFEPEDILLTRGAHGALASALAMVVDPGDEVVFVSPPWFFYEVMIVHAGATPVRVRCDEQTWDLDVDAIERALTRKTRLVLINTPNNPTGRIYPAETLERLGRVLAAHEETTGRPLYLLVDEAYSKVLYDGNRMITPAHHYPSTMLVHTYSKSSLAPGQHVGFLALAPSIPQADREQLRTAFLAAGVANGNGDPDNLMQYALPEIEHITLDMGRLQRRRDRVLSVLRAAGYDVHTPEATFYLMPRCPIDDDLAFAKRLAREKVLILPGRAFEMPGWFRISLTGTDEMFDRALPMFERAAAS
jgi:aspartate aminotransferase